MARTEAVVEVLPSLSFSLVSTSLSPSRLLFPRIPVLPPRPPLSPPPLIEEARSSPLLTGRTFPPFLSPTASFALRTRWTSRSRSSRSLRSCVESLPPVLSWRVLRSSIWRWRRSGLRWARRSVLWAATAAFPLGSMG